VGRILFCSLGLAVLPIVPAIATPLPADVRSADVAAFRLEDVPRYVDGQDPSVMAQDIAAMAQDTTGTAPSPSVAEPVQGPVVTPPVTMAADGKPAPDPSRYRNLGSQIHAVRYEMLAILAYYTAINAPKLFEDPIWPHFHNEHWFGKSTNNVGMDKLAHAYSTYVISELIWWRLKHKTGGAPGIQYTAALLGSLTMLQTEFWDSIEPGGGWSWQDVTFNTLGAGFSILRNSVPGLDEKLDYRLMVVPDENGIRVRGKEHFQQQRYFFALKLSGFKTFEKSPFRFLELHAGYYGQNFTNDDRAHHIDPKRHLFVGFGVNLRELFFKNSKGKIAHAAAEALDYFQPPYTAVQISLTD